MCVWLGVVINVCRSSSRANLDPILHFHPLEGRRMVPMAGVAVVAVDALALRAAFYARSEALTVIFAAWWFFTGASFGGDEGRHSHEMPWISVVCHLLGVVYGVAVSGVVLASCADAIFVAESALREAFAVQFETVYFCALAAGVVWLLPFSLALHLLLKLSPICCRDGGIRWGSASISLVEQFFKEIFSDATGEAILIDEAHWWCRVAVLPAVAFKHGSNKNIESRLAWG